MLKQARLLFLLAATVLLGSSPAFAQDNAVTVEAMKQLEQQWSEIFASDPANRGSLYAEDAIFDDVTAQPVIGKEAIEALYAADADNFVEGQTGTFNTTEAFAFGDWGYTLGVFSFQAPGEEEIQGNYVHVMKLVDGELKMFRHIFSFCDGACQ